MTVACYSFHSSDFYSMEIFKQNISKDMFKRKAELSIKRKQGRKETQGGGFYTEEAMRTDLKYSQNPGFKFKP